MGMKRKDGDSVQMWHETASTDKMPKAIGVIGIMLSILAILGGIWFLLPTIMYGIVNIGNVTGEILCIFILLYGILQGRIHSFCHKTWKNKRGRKVLLVFGIVLAIIFMTGIAATTKMISAAVKKPSGKETIVVLGCRVYGKNPSLMLIERMDAAYDYLIKNPDTKAILSGGQGADEDISEAECMYQYLMDKGIDASRLFKEDQSTSTRENIAFSKKIIEENGFVQQIAIVTNEFHEYRAAEIAKKEGLNAKAVSAHTAWWLFPTYYMRELYGIVYETIT